MTTERQAKASVRITDRRRKVASLYLRHVDQADIGRQLGADRSTISRDVSALKTEWRDEAAEIVAERINQELAELDMMELECIAEFRQQRSTRWMLARLQVKEYRARLLGWLKPNATVLASSTSNTFTLALGDHELNDRTSLAEIERDKRVLAIVERARERDRQAMELADTLAAQIQPPVAAIRARKPDNTEPARSARNGPVLEVSVATIRA